MTSVNLLIRQNWSLIPPLLRRNIIYLFVESDIRKIVFLDLEHLLLKVTFSLLLIIPSSFIINTFIGEVKVLTCTFNHIEHKQ